MPTERVGLPIGGIDDREALLLQEGFASDLQNVRFYKNNIQRRGGWKKFDSAISDPDIPNGRTFAMVTLSNLPAPPPGTIPQTGAFLLYDTDKVWLYSPSTRTWNVHNRVTSSIPGPSIYERYSITDMFDIAYSISPGTPLSTFDGVTYQELVTDLGNDENGVPITLRGLGLLQFNNHLIVVRPYFNGWLPSSIKWSANGEPTKWNVALNDSAGSLPVVEQSTLPLTCGFTLAGRAYLAQEKNIHELIATGSLSPIFKTEPRITGKGIIATDSWAATNTFGFFLGADNVYQFDGSSITAVGDPIKETLLQDVQKHFFSIDGSARNIHACLNTRRTEYYLFLSSTDIHKVYIYDYNQNRWYKDVLGIPPTTFGLYEPGSNLSGQGLPQFVAVLQNQGSFYIDENLPDFDASIGGTQLSIDSYVTTKDYFSKDFSSTENPYGKSVPIPTMGKYNILQTVQIQSSSEVAIEVSVSFDSGQSWLKKNITTNRKGIGWAFFNNSFQTVRFRFRSLSTKALFLKGFIAYSWQAGGVITK